MDNFAVAAHTLRSNKFNEFALDIHGVYTGRPPSTDRIALAALHVPCQ